MMGTKTNPMTAAALLALVAALAGCDAGPSATPARDHSAAALAAASETARKAPAQSARAANDDAPVPQFKGRPLWSANSKYTAEENAEYHFKRNGEAFGADTVDAFVAKAHAFVNDPPKAAKTVTRSNGDRMIYDAKSNTFAVATREGAPRTMFHPDDGAAYWDKQVAKEASRSEG
jgi:pyocin large subunit-like protein